MSELLLLLMVFPLLAFVFVLISPKEQLNGYYVVIFAIFSSILLIIRIFSQLNFNEVEILYNYSYTWIKSTNTELNFTIESSAMLLLLGCYISLIIGCVGLSDSQRRNKSTLLMALFFMWNFTGFLIANDMLSFYMFFSGMLMPLLILIGQQGGKSKNITIYTFFIFHLMGALLLLAAIVMLYQYNHGNTVLPNMALIKMPRHIGFAVWLSVCLSLLFRIPIWPFQQWISGLNSNIKNPLIYIIISLLPLSGLYSFMRFWQLTIPIGIRVSVPVIEFFGVLTMIFIAIIGLVNRNFLQKLFSFSTVYYLLFLLAIILLPEAFLKNITYSLFTFLIVNSSLTVLNLWAEEACLQYNCEYRGVLLYMPRLSAVFSFFVLIAAGLPVSAMFWNNFMIISALFHEKFFLGLSIMFAVTMVGLILIYELYVMRDLQHKMRRIAAIRDISDRRLAFFALVIALLFLSFFNPLWFVI